MHSFQWNWFISNYQFWQFQSLPNLHQIISAKIMIKNTWKIWYINGKLNSYLFHCGNSRFNGDQIVKDQHSASFDQILFYIVLMTNLNEKTVMVDGNMENFTEHLNSHCNLKFHVCESNRCILFSSGWTEKKVQNFSIFHRWTYQREARIEYCYPNTVPNSFAVAIVDNSIFFTTINYSIYWQWLQHNLGPEIDMLTSKCQLQENWNRSMEFIGEKPNKFYHKNGFFFSTEKRW